MLSQAARSCPPSPATAGQSLMLTCEGNLRIHESAEKADLQTKEQKDGADTQRQIKRHGPQKVEERQGERKKSA